MLLHIYILRDKDGRQSGISFFLGLILFSVSFGYAVRGEETQAVKSTEINILFSL